MERISFNKLLLKTAFSCMACDGEIDPKEVKLIESLHEEKKLFGDIDLFAEVNKHRKAINASSGIFLKGYFNELASNELSQAEELKIIEVAIDTIKADKKIKYSEIKFFKVIRSKLRIDNEPILAVHPDFEEYLEQDIISETYLARLQDDFFDSQTLPEFKFINAIDGDILNNLPENKD